LPFYEGPGGGNRMRGGEVEVTIDAGCDVRGKVRPFVAQVGFAGYFDRRRGSSYGRSADGGVDAGVSDGRTCRVECRGAPANAEE